MALLFHHTRPLEHSLYGKVRQHRWEDEPFNGHPDSDKRGAIGCECSWCEWEDQKSVWDPAYRWHQQVQGYYPLFLAVGHSRESLQATGYDYQFRRTLAWNKEGSVQRKAGSQPNHVLFSWKEQPSVGTYSSIGWWSCILNSLQEGEEGSVNLEREFFSERDERSLWKKSWKAARWIREADKGLLGDVQLTVESLDLASADLVCARNAATRKKLIEKGWDPGKVITQYGLPKHVLEVL